MDASRTGRLARLAAVVMAVALSTAPAVAGAAVQHVPQRFATIQAAVDGAAPGDEIRVARGSYCGATIDKPLTLIADAGVTIVGCADGPILFGELRAGFVLPGAAGTSAASGTRITGFVFDGRGVSETNLDPLALGVFARFASDVQVTGNLFLGTVEAINNTAGDRWLIARNRIEGLTLFDCTGSLCAGGDGITIGIARGDVAAPGGDAAAVNRPEGNVVVANDVEGTIPDGFDVFDMAGIFVFAADGTLVERNRLVIPENPAAGAQGYGILVDDVCCGNATPIVPGARNTVLLFNDGRRSQLAVQVEGTGGANTQGLVLFGDLGVIEVEGNQLPVRRFASARRQHLF
jgi:nitrous oxidase accessory protein NosD